MKPIAQSIAALAALLFLAACAPNPAVPQPASGGGSANPVASVATSQPIEVITADSTAGVAYAYPATTIDLSAITPTPVPTLAPPANGNPTVVTLQNNGQTLTLHAGDRFLLQLGETYNWQVIVADQSVVGRVKNVMVIRGAQGLFEALHSGQTEFSAQGDAACRQAKPACMLPSILFRLTVVVE